jgi:hypothetical protein
MTTDHSEPTAQPETDAAGIAQVMEAVYDYRDEDTRENRERVEQAVRLYGIEELADAGCYRTWDKRNKYRHCFVAAERTTGFEFCPSCKAKQQRDQMNAGGG